MAGRALDSRRGASRSAQTDVGASKPLYAQLLSEREKGDH